MISDLLELLKKDDRLYAWNVTSVNKDEYQLYFIKQQLQMNREIVVNEYYVTIFVKDRKKGKELLGTSSFQLYSSMSIEEIKKKIDEQILLSKYTLNEMYSLPKKANLKPISKDKGFDGHSLKDAAFIAADALFEADKFDKGYINSSEIFIDCIETRFFDSNDNVFLNIKQHGKIEIVTTWCEKNHEIELSKLIDFEELDTNYIQSQANELLIQASNRIKAEKTPEINNISVILKDEYVKTFFKYFMDKCKTDTIYDRMSNYHLGYEIQNKENKADLLSMRLEPMMKKSTKGAPFDKEGIALKRLNIIENGVVKNLWGSNAKSQYLNKMVYGCFDNFVVNGGSLTLQDLEDESYLEIISLSDLEIDLITGDLSSEIRLAYLYYKNKEKQIVTGGAISGNIEELIHQIRFSSETTQINNFMGPKYVLLPNLKITKGQ